MADEGCFTFGAYNIDKVDRPALRSSAAVWECANERGHLADAPLLAEAIRAGLPGSGAFLRTGDAAYYPNATGLAWTGMATTWEPSSAIEMIDLRTPAPFRCYGPSGAVSPNPNTIANEFIAPTSAWVGETMDRAATGWAAAHDACFMAGGHLPRAAELSELISQGMPNGSGSYLWTADEVGDATNTASTVDFLAEVLTWTGLDRRFSFAWTMGAADQTATWDWKYMTHPFRCIYYPIDTSYTAPTNCYAGCFEVALPGTPAATMWFDSQDRAAATLGSAFGDCEASGGHLAVRARLHRSDPQRPAERLEHADPAVDVDVGLRAEQRHGRAWTNVEPDFADQYSTYMTWAGPANAYGYRCMWTNEVR